MSSGRVNRNNGQTCGHSFHCYQTLRFRSRGEAENVGRLQIAWYIFVGHCTDKIHAIGDAHILDILQRLFPEMLQRLVALN